MPDQDEKPDHDAEHSDDKKEDSKKDDAGDDKDKSGDDKKQGDDKDKKDDKKKGPGKKPLIILGIIVVLIIIAGLIWWFATRNQVSTDDAYTDGDAVTIAPKVSGYVVVMNLGDNKFVHKNDLLIKIDPRDYQAQLDQANAQLGLAKAQLNAAQVQLAIARVQYPAQLTQAKAQQQSAQANLTQSRAAYERQHSVDVRATSQQNIDTANAQQQSALANVAQARAQVKTASLVPQQISQAQATVDERREQVHQAEAQVEAAALNLSYTELRAPADGWVTKRNVQYGTFLQAGTSIFSLVTTTVWITANFKESQLERMRPGDAVDVSVDAYPDLKLHGHVDSIQLGSGSRFSAFPAENATGNFVKIVQRVPVKILIDNGLQPDLPLPLGLSVVPKVMLK
ncbi:multidrug export protein EmrA [Burkholderia sp. PAMC 28687]|jgi:membrane fusion protein (multidrug efflux system)|uniref:Membrane fusion component of tripartite multidrug resistance system n=1 Tax=Caballeronia sordidicola TaxID=196367 RepID=A0A242MUX0_CABSO|nr:MULTISPECIES: HlyD family secretion protein [Burkholderiaceae]AMM17235.1 multidrug export protein EmrA [Burkholderia sp. PAMC 28687]OTP75239.1 Membrane fusion component of tripartite multidrug resistance system [Caballeronia sordidicola]